MRTGGIGGREITAWCVAMLALAAIRFAVVGGPQFCNDSYQYLSIAANLERHGAIETSILHFDEERARGRLPAPETTFPPGYPLLLWSLSWTGIPLEWIGLLLSLTSAAGVLLLLRAGARALGASARATRLTLLIWAFSAQAALYAITLSAESVFAFTSTAAIVLLVADEARAREASWRVPVAFQLAATAVFLRYAGIFLVLALHVHAARRVPRERRRLGTWALALAACDLPVGALLVRNMGVAGVWLGGNSRPVHRAMAAVLHDLGTSSYELALGSIRDPRSMPFGLFALLLCAGVVGTLALRSRDLVRTRRAGAGSGLGGQALPLLYAATYCAAVSLAGAITQISLSGRLFVPLVPVLALLAGPLLVREPSPTGKLRGALLGMLVGAYGAVNVQSSFSPGWVAEHRWVARAMAGPVREGEPLSRWMHEWVPRDAVLLSISGQGTGYLLGRPTVSIPGRLFTDLAWTEEETRRIATRFGVSWVIVFPEVVAGGGVDRLESPFFRDLAAKRPPPWLALAAENARVLIYRVRGQAPIEVGPGEQTDDGRPRSATFKVEEPLRGRFAP